MPQILSEIKDDLHVVLLLSCFVGYPVHIHQENRIYIRVKITKKSVKRPFCCTVSILQVYFTYLCYITFWALEHHFREKKTKL